MIYSKAEYKRTTGLGNKLFPWSRAKVFAAIKNGKILHHIWFSPRGAGITRGGVDQAKAFRKIWLWKNFRSDSSTLSWALSKWKTTVTKPVFLADDLFKAEQLVGKHQDAMVVFRWNSCHDFRDLQPYSELIKQALMDITLLRQKKFIAQFENYEFIGLNIRAGNDFINADSNEPGYRKTALSWFVEALLQVREKYGNLPAIIVSDGGPKQLAEILSQPDIQLLDSETAIADLLVLTKAKVLLGSGNSTFSAWASFLGKMDTYSSAATPFNNYHINYNRPEQVVDIL